MPAWTTSPKKEQPSKPLLSLLGFSSKRGLSTELTKSADPSAISVIIGKLPLKGTLHSVPPHSGSLPEGCLPLGTPSQARPDHLEKGFTPFIPEHALKVSTEGSHRTNASRIHALYFLL